VDFIPRSLELLSSLVYPIDSSSGRFPADFTFINSVDELHAGNDIGQLPEASKPAPALLGAHGQLMHQRQTAIDAVAISGLGRSESKNRQMKTPISKEEARSLRCSVRLGHC